MAWPAWAQAAAQGGSGLLGPIASGLMNRWENNRSRDYNEKMYWNDVQVARENANWQNATNEQHWRDQNAYDLQMWNLHNQYDSPMAQMARFKEAGLNPNLIYGQMGSSPAIATAQFGSAPGAPHSGPTPAQATHWDIKTPTFISDMLQFKQVAAQTDNIKAQTDLANLEAIKKSAETQAISTGNEKSMVELDNLKKYSADAAQVAIDRNRAETNKVITDTEIGLSRNEREAAANAMGLKEAAERILNLRGQRANMELENQLKSLDIQMRSLGIMPGDNLFMRLLARFFNSDTGTEFGNWMNDKWQGSYENYEK